MFLFFFFVGSGGGDGVIGVFLMFYFVKILSYGSCVLFVGWFVCINLFLILDLELMVKFIELLYVFILFVLFCV